MSKDETKKAMSYASYWLLWLRQQQHIYSLIVLELQPRYTFPLMLSILSELFWSRQSSFAVTQFINPKNKIDFRKMNSAHCKKWELTKIDSEVNRKNVVLTKKLKVYILERLLFIILMNQVHKPGCFVYKAKVGRKSVNGTEMGISCLLSAPENENIREMIIFLNLCMENFNSILLPLWVNSYWRRVTCS